MMGAQYKCPDDYVVILQLHPRVLLKLPQESLSIPIGRGNLHRKNGLALPHVVDVP